MALKKGTLPLTPEEKERRKPLYQLRYCRSLKGARSKFFAALWYYYRVTPEQYHGALQKQAGCCALCDKQSCELHIDHCHSTGKFRGLLCRPCNVSIGTLGDNEAGLLRALAYVRGE